MVVALPVMWTKVHEEESVGNDRRSPWPHGQKLLLGNNDYITQTKITLSKVWKRHIFSLGLYLKSILKSTETFQVNN